MKQQSNKYRGIIECAKQNEYYSTLSSLSANSREFYANKAKELYAEADALPDNFVDQKFYPEPGFTYGT